MRPARTPGAPKPVPAPRPPAVQTEEEHYSLFLGGQPAGSGRWTATPERGALVLRRETLFGGQALSGSWAGRRVLEISRLEPKSGFPTQYSETTEGGGRGHFEAAFDRKAGLLTVRQGRDEASAALVRDLHDPVSLVHSLRFLPEEVTSLRVPMVGGTALVTRLPDQVLETPWGERPARVYYLRPGLAVVYIEAEEPHRVLRLTQTTATGVLESVIARPGARPAAPKAPEPRGGNRPPPAEGGGRRRRRRPGRRPENP